MEGNGRGGEGREGRDEEVTNIKKTLSQISHSAPLLVAEVLTEGMTHATVDHMLITCTSCDPVLTWRWVVEHKVIAEAQPENGVEVVTVTADKH